MPGKRLSRALFTENGAPLLACSLVFVLAHQKSVLYTSGVIVSCISHVHDAGRVCGPNACPPNRSKTLVGISLPDASGRAWPFACRWFLIHTSRRTNAGSKLSLVGRSYIERNGVWTLGMLSRTNGLAMTRPFAPAGQVHRPRVAILIAQNGRDSRMSIRWGGVICPLAVSTVLTQHVVERRHYSG